MNYRAGSLRHTIPGFGAEAALGLFHPSMKRLARRRINARGRILEGIGDEGDGDGGLDGIGLGGIGPITLCDCNYQCQDIPSCQQDCNGKFELEVLAIAASSAGLDALCTLFGSPPAIAACQAAVATTAALAVVRAAEQQRLCYAQCIINSLQCRSAEAQCQADCYSQMA